MTTTHDTPLYQAIEEHHRNGRFHYTFSTVYADGRSIPPRAFPFYTEEDVHTFMRFKNRLSKTFVNKLAQLKPGQEFVAMRNSLDSELIFRRLTPEEIDAHAALTQASEELARLRQEIRDLVPEALRNQEKDAAQRVKELKQLTQIPAKTSKKSNNDMNVTR